MTTTTNTTSAADGVLLTTKQLAEKLQVRDFTIREWRRLGIITPAVHLNRVMRWRLADVLADLDRARAEERG
jgi:predicted site-specific integrase-resolvase